MCSCPVCVCVCLCLISGWVHLCVCASFFIFLSVAFSPPGEVITDSSRAALALGHGRLRFLQTDPYLCSALSPACVPVPWAVLGASPPPPSSGPPSVRPGTHTNTHRHAAKLTSSTTSSLPAGLVGGGAPNDIFRSSALTPSADRSSDDWPTVVTGRGEITNLAGPIRQSQGGPPHH